MMDVLGILHVPFEDFGSLGEALRERGAVVNFLDACTARYESLDILSPHLVVVMGGPIGVYEAETYPFLKSELALLRARVARRRPTLGICLGAQLLAAALGASVYPGTRGKEIGWAALDAGPDAAACPAISELLAPGVAVLHWHGDTFDLPAEAKHLASTSLYPNQAWCLGESILGLQFHPEVNALDLERWFVGHTCELSAAHIDIPRLRAASQQFAPALHPAARRFWARWLEAAVPIEASSQRAGRS